MPRLNIARIGHEVTGWSKKGGTAAEYESTGSDYRTYKPRHREEVCR